MANLSNGIVTQFENQIRQYMQWMPKHSAVMKVKRNNLYIKDLFIEAAASRIKG